jgi:parvulin-like peptidyl-prolyl isomerase
MFEGLRKNSQSFLLVVLVSSLAVLFGTQFGPGQRGCGPESFKVNYIARVYGNTIGEQDFQSMARLTNLGERQNQRVLRQAIVDGLIERELLAHEAERLGYRVSDEEMNQEIRDGYTYMSLGSRQIAELTGGFGPVPLSARQRVVYSRTEAREPDAPPPAFNYDDFEQWVRGAFGRTVPDYKRLLAREMLAERMRQAVMVNVRASEDEVWRDYERGHNQVTLRYIEFSPDFYRTVVNTDDQAAVDAFAQAHQSEINQQWEQRRESLRGLPEQVRIRQILLRFPENAEEPARIATMQRAQVIRDRIAAGQDFVRMARLYSQDESHWRDAGESSWVAPDRVDAPDDVKRALAGLQPGQVSQPIRSPLGVHIVQLLGRRQGDVAEADAKRDIARELYRIVRGNELANEAANRAQQLLAAPGATMDSVAAQLHTEGLTAFYRGPVPPPETLPGNNVLEPVSHTDVGAPELRETQPFTRTATIPGIENSEGLVRAAFQLTEQNPAPSAPVAIGDERFVIRLKEGGRQMASREEFEREKPRLMEEYVLAKRRETLQQYIARLRAAAERAGNVRIGNSPLIQQRGTGREGTPEQGAG